jgi:hypothetical protein
MSLGDTSNDCPDFNWIEKLSNGNVSGLGFPPPKEIIPGRLKYFCNALIADGFRRPLLLEMNFE